MGKHVSSEARHLPRKAVLGILLALLLLGGLSARALGVAGDAQDTAETTGTAGPAAPSATAGSAEPSTGQGTAAPAPAEDATSLETRRPGKTSSKGRPEVKVRTAGGSAKPGRPSQRTSENQKSLADAVQNLLDEPEIEPTSFRLASFNVLGSSHTARGGNKPGYASGVARIGMAVQVLRSLGVDLVGFQEFEPVQNASFLNRTGGGFATYPGMKLGKKGVRNSVAWRTATWDLVSAHTIPIPYFRGNRVPMPYVNLENRSTGQRIWVVNIHNPTSNPRRGQNERWRDLGTRLQAALVTRLRAQTEEPVILMGDFNERAEAFCTVTARAPVQAANGGSTGPDCRLPADVGIDWIFGTLDIEFSNYMRTRRGLVARATDHPIVVADAVISP